MPEHSTGQSILWERKGRKERNLCCLHTPHRCGMLTRTRACLSERYLEPYLHQTAGGRPAGKAVHLVSPGLFSLWWSGTVSCCWTQSEVSSCLSQHPLLFLSLALQTRERAGRKAWRSTNPTEKRQQACPPVHRTKPWERTMVTIGNY